MALLLELRPEEEQHLQHLARAQGVRPEDYVRRLVARDMERQGQTQRNQAAVALLDGWIAEARAVSDDEARQAEAEWREDMGEVDENRLSHRLRFPELARPKDEESRGL